MISKVIHLETTLRNVLLSQLMAYSGINQAIATTIVDTMPLTQVIKTLATTFLATPIGMISAIAIGPFAVAKVKMQRVIFYFKRQFSKRKYIRVYDYIK